MTSLPKTIVICGKFDDRGGRPSSYCRKLFNEVPIDKMVNGGHFDNLPDLASQAAQHYDIVFWFADVPNDKPKLIDGIKKESRIFGRECILISSKNNGDGKYDFLELTDRALKSQSNLFVVFTQSSDKIVASVYDPLGNEYISSDNIEDVQEALMDRVGSLLRYTRIKSVSIGDEIVVPDEQEFFEFSRDLANRLFVKSHSQIKEPSRFLGNLSFRCNNGFPSFRDNNLIYVSRRNIDKRGIDKSGFVAVDATSLNEVRCYGFKKPSVDTPIQLRLFDYYPKINYILHTHAYIPNAKFTDKIIPCGAIEEFDSIRRLFDNPAYAFFTANLLGHGSIVLASRPSDLKSVKFVNRIIPEKIDLPIDKRIPYV